MTGVKIQHDQKNVYNQHLIYKSRQLYLDRTFQTNEIVPAAVEKNCRTLETIMYLLVDFESFLLVFIGSFNILNNTGTLQFYLRSFYV